MWADTRPRHTVLSGSAKMNTDGANSTAVVWDVAKLARPICQANIPAKLTEDPGMVTLAGDGHTAFIRSADGTATVEGDLTKVID